MVVSYPGRAPAQELGILQGWTRPVSEKAGQGRSSPGASPLHTVNKIHRSWVRAQNLTRGHKSEGNNQISW